MRFVIVAVLLSAFSVSGCDTKAPSVEAPAAAGSCDHGVKSEICTRCNPKLEPVFRAKNDWCPEHTRAESQCVICNPELAQQGIK